MDWTVLLQEIIAVLVPIVVGVLTYLIKNVTKSMKENDHAIIQTIGELAYREIERNMEGVSGQEKMTAAINQVRSRLDQHGRFAKVSDEEIVAAIQKAWTQNEGQYK